MKIAITLGTFSVGIRPLDFHFNNIYDSVRGLTGTDYTFVSLGKELAKLSHDVSLFTVMAEPHNKPSLWENCKLYNLNDLSNVVDDSFDAVISINEPDIFRVLNTTKPFRICWNMLNDFSYCQPGFDNYVDKWLGVCDMHTNHLKKQTLNPNKWDTLILGCEPELYTDQRVYGRIIWTSSPDRGLHWLLSAFPEIKKAVPEAHLKIFYHINYDYFCQIEPNRADINPDIKEMANRLRYIRNSIERLKPLGVDHIGSISKTEMTKQLNEASVLGYTADPVAFSEGYSISILEAHASYTVPVITNADCLGSIYKDSGCVMIPVPLRNKISEYADAVIKSLTEKDYSDQIISKCRDFAKQRTWKIIAADMEKIIINK